LSSNRQHKKETENGDGFLEVKYTLLRLFFLVMGMVPPWARKWLSWLLGRTAYIVDREHRTIVIDNLTRVFGDIKTGKEIRALARRVFCNTALMLFEIGWFTRLGPSDIPKHFRITGFEHFKKALSKGRGVFALTAHIGNWELLPVAPAMGIENAAFVYRPLDKKVLDLFFGRQRTKFGAKMIPSKKAMFKIIRNVTRGGCVLLLMDQNVDWYEGVFVEFFGHYACTNKGLALMAMKTKTPVVPMFLVRDGKGYNIIFEDEIPLAETGDRTKDIEENTRRYNKAIESIILRYPDQWFWLHQRWKTRPFCNIADNPWR